MDGVIEICIMGEKAWMMDAGELGCMFPRFCSCMNTFSFSSV